MSSPAPARPDVLDADARAILAAAVAPLEGDLPAGPDLRDDTTPQSPYSRLRDARAEARAEERAQDHETASDARPPSGWAIVETLGLDLLAGRSKDIEIASWVAESLARRRGLRGLALAATILARLVENFWNNGLHPAADPEDPEARLFALNGLSGSDRDGSLMQPLRKLALFETPDGVPVTLWQYERASSIAALPDAARKQALGRGGIVAFDTLEIVARGTGRVSLVETGRAALDARAAWHALETALAATDAASCASTGRVAALLDGLVQIVLRYVPEAELSPAEAAVLPTADIAGEEETSMRPPETGAPPQRSRGATREELLDEILRIATLFRESEPNAPLSYTLEEAVRRARLPLPELLRELIPDLSPRSAVLTHLGIRPPEA